MAQRLKTKVSPCSFRLNDEARKALIIEESLNPGKTRGQIISELIIAKVTGKPTPPPIEFAEFSAEEIFTLRVITAENMKVAERFRIASRHATPRSDKDAFYLEIAKEAKAAVESCKETERTLSKMAKNSASYGVPEIFNLKKIYDRTAKLQETAVKKLSSDPEAAERANMWGEFANFVRRFLPQVGPEIKIVTAQVKEIKDLKEVKEIKEIKEKAKEETKEQLQKQPLELEGGLEEMETFEVIRGGFNDA